MKKDKLLGDQKDIIPDLGTLIGFFGKTVYLVTVPSRSTRSGYEYYGNTFLNTWVPGDLYSEYGERIEPGSLDDKMDTKEDLYLVDKDRSIERDGVEHKAIINLKDYNITGKTEFLNAIFSTKQGANNYRVWIKMHFKSNDSLYMLKPGTFRGRIVPWEQFKEMGVVKTEDLGVYR